MERALKHAADHRIGSRRSVLPRPRSVLLVTGYYLRAIHEGVVRYARQAGWILDATMTHTHRIPSDWRGDGVLAHAPTRAMMARVTAFGRPVAMVLSSPVGTRFPGVLMDSQAAGRMAAEHLRSRGFTRMAYYQRADGPVVNARRAAFREHVQAAGCEYRNLHWGTTRKRHSRLGRIAWLAGELVKLRQPLGVFASGDSWALDVLNACKAAGLSVPEQLAVIGVDNDPLYVDVGPVPLTSIDINLPGLGYEAAALLDRLMRGETAPAAPLIVPPIEVIVRKSTDTLAVEDVNVARAVSFMLEHFRRPIRVSDAASTSPVSLRRLQQVFKRELGRTLSQELARLRLNHALDLLKSTDDKVDAIARASGFASGRYLSRVMSQSLGLGPRAYRAQRCRDGER